MKFYVSHWQNRYLQETVEKLAEEVGVELRHNATCFSKFAGMHRYLILNAGAKNLTISSNDLIDYIETPYSRNFLPSIKDERRCLEWMIQELKDSGRSQKSTSSDD